MAEEDLQRFLEKVGQLNAFVALTEADPALRRALQDCGSHHAVVDLARSHGFEIGRRWGDAAAGPGAGPSHLLDSPCPEPGQERIERLLDTPGLRLERIHSCSHATPPDQWYDQAEHEWVMVLRGSARLVFEAEPQPRDLSAGDWLMIEAHRRHRVLATDPPPGTLWIAAFWAPASRTPPFSPASSRRPDSPG
jgi:cupin 2 domain-containing protein